MALSRRLIAGYILLILISIISVSCYTFNPGSTTGAKTITIKTFPNNSNRGTPNLPQFFTEKLKSYYQSNSSLSIASTGGDWELSGFISSYVVTPIAPQQNQTAGGNRLTISVMVNYNNKLDPKKNFEQPFSFYADYGQSENLSQVESRLQETIFNQIVFDIYTKTTSDW